MASDKPNIDPRLTALVVVGVTVVFMVTAIAAIATHSQVGPEWFVLMGAVVGGVLGYGALNRGGGER